jgi:photosystem II stability/assembly factor-like uncharacterized protein
MRTSALALALAFTAIATPAAANGRFPAASQLVIQRTDPTHMVLRTTFGILFSSDRGANWDWICEAAIGYSGSEDPSLGATASGAVVAGTSIGLFVSPDRGCAWNPIGGELTKEFIVDVVVRPDQLHTALVVTNKYVGQTDAGGSSYDTRLFLSSDDGATWAPQGSALDPSLLAETIEVAKSDPTRIYVSAIRSLPAADGGLGFEGLVYVSKDTGATWTKRTVPLIAGEERPLIAAVDPVNPDRLYVRTSGTGASRLLISDDAGQTYSPKFTGTGALKAFALSADGSKLYVGGEADGVNLAATGDFVFKKTSGIKADCFALDGDTLYACASDGIDHFTVGASTDDGATFTPLLHLSTVRGPLGCDPASPGGRCVETWPSVQATLGGGQAPDAGVTKAPPDQTPPPPINKKGGCACTEGDATSGSTGLALVALTLISPILRRRNPVAIRPRNPPSRGSR